MSSPALAPGSALSPWETCNHLRRTCIHTLCRGPPSPECMNTNTALSPLCAADGYPRELPEPAAAVPLAGLVCEGPSLRVPKGMYHMHPSVVWSYSGFRSFFTRALSSIRSRVGVSKIVRWCGSIPTRSKRHHLRLFPLLKSRDWFFSPQKNLSQVRCRVGVNKIQQTCVLTLTRSYSLILFPLLLAHPLHSCWMSS